MLKTFITSTLIITAALPVKAQVGPGLGPSDAIADNRGTYASVCTRTAQGRLSMRTGPGTYYNKITFILYNHV